MTILWHHCVNNVTKLKKYKTNKRKEVKNARNANKRKRINRNKNIIL